jgi:hypothetical protein
MIRRRLRDIESRWGSASLEWFHADDGRVGGLRELAFGRRCSCPFCTYTPDSARRLLEERERRALRLWRGVSLR